MRLSRRRLAYTRTQMDSGAVSVVRADLLSPAAQDLIGCLNAEMTARYPEDGATFFRLDADEVAEGRGAFLIAYLGSRAVGCGAVSRIGHGIGEINHAPPDAKPSAHHRERNRDRRQPHGTATLPRNNHSVR